MITLALGTLPNEQIGNATSVQNLVRNIGASIGLSFVSTMLVRAAQAHQALMVGHLSPLNPQYQQHLQAAQGALTLHFSPADALERARSLLYHTLLQQANYWSFVDIFYMVAWLCGFCLLGVWLFQRPRRPRAAVTVE